MEKSVSEQIHILAWHTARTSAGGYRLPTTAPATSPDLMAAMLLRNGRDPEKLRSHAATMPNASVRVIGSKNMTPNQLAHAQRLGESWSQANFKSNWQKATDMPAHMIDWLTQKDT